MSERRADEKNSSLHNVPTGAYIDPSLIRASADGRGTAKDVETAYAWISAAAFAGDPRGKEILHALEKMLTPEQIAEAREQARRLTAGELSARNFVQ
jgi:TPR repeat protein